MQIFFHAATRIAARFVRAWRCARNTLLFPWKNAHFKSASARDFMRSSARACKKNRPHAFSMSFFPLTNFYFTSK
jgi:hypothetical protein